MITIEGRMHDTNERTDQDRAGKDRVRKDDQIALVGFMNAPFQLKTYKFHVQGK